ncbi:uncharacterized protein LOC112681850 [Sipha flava]|nr:uncharacterized protein LOC112681850 [Sipha flava]
MTKKEFKSFKLSLPKPHENYENYMIRIELLKMNGFKGIQYIFPEDLFDDIKMSYPKADEFISVYKTRLISYDYECYVKNVAQFIQDFEEVITKSLEHMFFNYL